MRPCVCVWQRQVKRVRLLFTADKVIFIFRYSSQTKKGALCERISFHGKHGEKPLEHKNASEIEKGCFQKPVPNNCDKAGVTHFVHFSTVDVIQTVIETEYQTD